MPLNAGDLLLNHSIADFAAFHIDPEELNDLVELHGIGCDYRPAVRCPCARIETAGARSGCPACFGLGFLYPEDLRTPIVALVLNRSSQRKQLPPGEITDGQVLITFPLGVLPSIGDQVWPDGEVHVVQELIWRARQQTDGTALRARALVQDELAPRVPAGEDLLLYPDALDVDALFWLDVASRPRRAAPGDYRLSGRRITWKGDAGPAPGSAYSVRYRAPGAYMVQNSEPLFRSEGDRGFPWRARALALYRLGEGDLR